MSERKIMDNKLFKEEIHTYIDELYSEFEAYQNDVIDTLHEFNRVCRRHNIWYYMGFGSLLGVYRDGVVLPWDYDIDVIVPIYEKEHLISALEEDLSEEFYFHCPEVDPKCRHYIMRITKKGYDSSAVHMDVFYLIGAPENNNKREKFRNRIKKVNSIRKIKLVDAKKESMGVNSVYYARLLNKLLYAFTPLWYLNKIEKYLCNKIDLKSAKYVSMMQAAADTYTSDIFQEPSEIKVRGVMCYAPSDIELFFKQTYRDYTSYPPIQSRFDEFFNSVKRLKYFHSAEETYNKMDFQINQY